MNETRNLKMHAIAFLGRVFLMAYLLGYMLHQTGQASVASDVAWITVVALGGLMMLLTIGDYYRDRVGNRKLLLLDAAYVFLIFMPVHFLPMQPVMKVFVAETAALLCLMVMNIMFAQRWPSRGFSKRKRS